MARPPKDEHDRMTEHLRIPVTPAQKRAVTEAAVVNPSGTAAWARDVLLRAASQQAASKPPVKRKRRATNGGK